MTTLLRLGFLSRSAWGWNKARPYVFLESGKLQDGELELIPPSQLWIDALMASVQHPATLQHSPALATLTRRQVTDFLVSSPHGHQQPSQSAGAFPCYHFWMLDHSRSDLPISGAICMRVGNGSELELYYGHFGYHVYPSHRGRHFAERSVRLLLPLARLARINPIWITCNPENQASRRTCERLGANLARTTALPSHHPLARGGETSKCSYRLDPLC